MDFVLGLLIGMQIGLWFCRFIWLWDESRKNRD